MGVLMSKKKLTRKKKKQLLAMFMATGIMAQNMIGTMGVFADVSPVKSQVSESQATESTTKLDNTIPFTHLAADHLGDTITSLYTENGRLRGTKTKDDPDAYHPLYYVYASDQSTFSTKDAVVVDNLVVDYPLTNLTTNTDLVSYKMTTAKYYYIAERSGDNDHYTVTPMARISGADLLADVSYLRAYNASVEYGSDWNDTIAKEVTRLKAIDKDGNDVASNVIVSGDVDTRKSGKYDVTFTSPESGRTITVTVTVGKSNIIGTEPEIHAEDKTYQVGETLEPLLGVTATDAEDGDLTDKVVADANGVNMSKAGDYTLKLSVTDSDGNTTNKNVTIHVVDKMTDGPVIKGADDVVIDERSNFDPLKDVTAQDSSGADITANLTYTGSVDTSVPGIYTIKYYVYDSEGRVASATRKVTVQSDDSKPVILANDLTVKQGSRFDPMLYVHAYDREDGDITDKVEVIGEVNTDKAAVQRITYTVTDSDGNYTEKTISVNVVATIGNGPVINGADDIELNVGDDFDPLSGVTAYDEEDGDLTAEIKVGGVINTGKAGEYEIIYTVWDSDYNVETVVRKVTVKNPVVAPTITSDKEIHVAYGSDWSDAIAKTKANAKATDGKGNDITKDIVVTSNPVDTNKAQSYVVEFSITTDGGTQTSKTTVIVDEEEKDYLLNPYKYVIGGDTYVTGKAGADVKYVSLYKEEGGKRTFLKRAPVINGNIKDYANGLITSKEEVIYAVAEDANQKTIILDGKAVEKQVELAMLGEEGDYRLNPDTFILGTEYITGVYDNEKANKLVLRVDGNIVNPNYPDQSVETFKLSSKGTITSVDQNVDILEYNSDGKLLVTRPVTIVEPGEVEYHLTANDYTVGEAEITGNYDNDLADKVKLIVDGGVKKQFITDPTQNTYHIAAKSFIDSADHDVYIAEYKGTQELTRVKVNVIQPAAKNYVLKPDAYTLGQANVTGTWSSDDESVQQVALFINGVRQSLGLANADGTFTLSTKGMITSPSDQVEVQFYTNAGKTPLGEKVAVTIQNDYKLAVDDYQLNDRVITGTYDSRYTTDKDQIQIVIDGVAVKNINHAASATAPGKEKEAFTIAATDAATGNLLITDKGQNVVIRHLKDGEVVKEEALVIK